MLPVQFESPFNRPTALAIAIRKALDLPKLPSLPRPNYNKGVKYGTS